MLWSVVPPRSFFSLYESRVNRGKLLNLQKSHMEVIARNEYMANDARDPVACSLFYFALGKSKLVHGLWRQAAWHKEQQVMLKFLGNDFRQARWRTAAMKNAFALLSKRRFGACFFAFFCCCCYGVLDRVTCVTDFSLRVLSWTFRVRGGVLHPRWKSERRGERVHQEPGRFPARRRALSHRGAE